MRNQRPTRQLMNGFSSIAMTCMMLFASSFNSVYSQVCETEVMDGPHHHLKNPDKDYALNLVIWKVADDAGNGTVSDENIIQTLSNSLGVFNEYGLYFDLVEIKTVNKSAYLHNPNFLIYEGYNSEDYVEGSLNYYLINPKTSAYSGAAAGKSGDFGRAWGFFDDQSGSGFVFCHELGHTLGLRHTFEANACYKDCETSGDYVCDTPPDPYVKQENQDPQVVGYTFVSPCSFKNVTGITTNCGEHYSDEGYPVPYAQNMMSYYIGYQCLDMKRFSPGQAERMKYKIENNPSIVSEKAATQNYIPLLKNQIKSRVWEDNNANGFEDSSESLMSDAVVKLFNADTNLEIANGSIDPNGNVNFEELANGNYYMQVISPYQLVSTAVVTEGIGENINFIDIDGTCMSNHFTIGNGAFIDLKLGMAITSKIGNKVWMDNGHAPGLLDGNDMGMEDVPVWLFEADDLNNAVDVRYTDQDGSYLFCVKPGRYRLQFELPEDYNFISQNGGDHSIDSNVDPNTGWTDIIEIGSNELRLDIDAGVLFNDDVTVAVSWLDFNTSWDVDQSEVLLDWEVFATDNQSHFLIQRSYGNTDNFEVIGEVANDSKYDEVTSFEFVDTQFDLMGDYYYRLISVDLDGSQSTSEIRSQRIELTLEEEVSIVAYPNPCTEMIYFDLSFLNEKDMGVGIYDQSGKLIKTVVDSKSMEVGLNSFSLNVSDLPTGVYLISFEFGSERLIEKISVENV